MSIMLVCLRLSLYSYTDVLYYYGILSFCDKTYYNPFLCQLFNNEIRWMSMQVIIAK